MAVLLGTLDDHLANTLNCLTASVEGTSERRGGAHNSGLLNAHRYRLEFK